MKRTIWTAVIIFLALLTTAIAFERREESSPILVTSIPHTSTPPSRPTRAPTPTPQPSSRELPGCVYWYELRNDLVGDNVCVRGDIKVMVRDDSKSDVVRIYLEPTLSRSDRRRIRAPKDFYLFDESSSYTDLRMGDCVTAGGELGINNDGVLFIRLDGNLEMCP